MPDERLLGGVSANRRSALVLSAPERAVFASGVASMAMEIVAGRMVTPAFGGSIFTWGSIIGVFLAALSVGYALGGRYARAHASRESLVALLAFSALAVALIAAGGDSAIGLFEGIGVPARYAPILPVTVLFGPPTFLLGLISPFAAELSAVESTGEASGRVYAVGTVGSIVGAFGATFVLIPTFEVATSGLLLAALLVLGAVSMAERTPESAAAIGVALLVVLSGSVVVYGAPRGDDVLVDTQTAYADLRVTEEDGVRTMYIGGVPQSATYVDGREGYVFDYAAYAHLPLLLQNDTERALFIGGGGFTIPQRYVEEYPNVTVDVAEIDPEVVRVAKEQFGLEEGPRMNVHVEDGRNYLERTNHTYDVIVLDAFRTDSVPFHLTTREFMRRVADALDEDGVLVANVITARSGSNAAFGRAMVKTMNETFPRTYQFPTSNTPALQNIELLATKSEERYTREEFRTLAANRNVGVDLSGTARFMRPAREVRTGEVPLLVDGDAPVDSLLAEQAGDQYVVSGWNDSGSTAAGSTAGG
jgi:spermidine synthase